MNFRIKALVILSLSVPYVNGVLERYQIIGNILSYAIELTRIQTFLFPSYPPHNRPTNDEFDFIIIGSSPSGSVVANRLTANPDVKVLLLENGEEASKITDIPFLAGALGFTSYDYGYRSESQPGFCRACPNGQLYWPHGNVLGGSSAINYMIYVRGNPGDYDKWAVMGNPGCSYKDILPYFIKLEDTQVKISDKNLRGSGGFLPVSDVKFRSELVDIYINASMEAGHPYVDYNGKRQLGVSYVQSTLKKGARCSAEKAYLRSVRKRENLRIQVKSKVTKILIDGKTKTAEGVEYYFNNKKHIVYAKKEVICSAGALNSPQILMLSGIGPKDHLQQLGIPLIKDLPVGKKMYDHVTFPAVIYEVDKPIVTDIVSAALNPFTYLGYLIGRGPLTTIGGVEALTFIKTNVSTDPDPLFPDVELLLAGGSINTDFGVVFRKLFNFSQKLFDKMFAPLIGKYIYLVTPTILHPKSCGWIKLKSKNPWDPPLFYPNFLSDPENHDLKTMIAAIREYERINTMPSLKKYGAKLLKIPVPGCERYEFDSDIYWECAIRNIVGSYWHQVSTYKMGPESDLEAVVDHELRVHGIKKLRIVDTSVVPVPLAAHNVAPAYVIGEKAADLIKQFYKL